MSNNRYQPIAANEIAVFYWTRYGVWVGVDLHGRNCRLVRSPLPVERMWVGALKVVEEVDADLIKEADAILEELDDDEVERFAKQYSVDDRMQWKQQVEQRFGIKLEFDDAEQP